MLGWGRLLMIENLSAKSVRLLLNNYIIKEEDQDIYKYGLELLFSTIINVILVITIGCLFGKLPQTILFLLEYCSVKRYAGGYHARTHVRCIVTFSVLYFIMLVVFEVFDLSKVNAASLLVGAISFLLVMILAPMEDANKPLEEEERKLYFLKCRQLLLLSSVINILLFVYIGNNSFVLFALAAMIWVGTAVFIGYIKNKV